MPRRRSRLPAVLQLAVAFWLAATSGCLCRAVPAPSTTGLFPPRYQRSPIHPYCSYVPRPFCHQPPPPPSPPPPQVPPPLSPPPPSCTPPQVPPPPPLLPPPPPALRRLRDIISLRTASVRSVVGRHQSARGISAVAAMAVLLNFHMLLFVAHRSVEVPHKTSTTTY
ncbi:hypothetical protein U9M48_002100 [Paspalum notatum var. saurae]|uniref:Uncharacterized protein n=1 Tax=Paspalum notatum var. saurae TaxID=547442 RepID=A0AAQ3PNA2_PASNO